MNVNQVIMAIVAVFFTLGAIDRSLGNRIGMGVELERGFSLMGTIALNVLGFTCIAPVVANAIKPAAVSICGMLGADAAMFPGLLLSPDCGGYAVATELAADPRIASFSGLVVAATVGSVISFTIPVACGILEKEDTRYLAIGILTGFVVDPIGCFVGGLIMGLPVSVVLHNLVPVVIFSLLIAAGLVFIPGQMIKGFRVFSKFLLILVAVGLALGVITKTTGLVILPGMNPIENGFTIVGNVTITLAGALPFIWFFRKVAGKPLTAISRRTGVDELAISCMLMSLSSFIPAFTNFKEVNIRSKVVIAATTASLSNVFGAHLGYVSATDENMMVPMIMAKVVAGALAMPLAVLASERIFKKELAQERAVITDR